MQMTISKESLNCEWVKACEQVGSDSGLVFGFMHTLQVSIPPGIMVERERIKKMPFPINVRHFGQLHNIFSEQNQ